MNWLEIPGHKTRRTQWFKGDSCRVSGWLYFDGQVIKGEQLVAKIDQLSSLEELQAVSGEFALVKDSGSGIELKSDCVGSIPVFYCFVDGEVFLSSDPGELLKIQAPEESGLLREQIACMLICGMSLGAQTIRKGIFRLQAKESLRLNGKEATQLPKRSVKMSPDLDYESAKEMGRVLLEAAISRTLNSIGEREICIPLSGGMDSRLLAFLLRELGSNSITCFSYGRQSSFESERSEKVAKYLGLKWHFVEYNPKKWKEWWEDDRYQDYRKWASSMTAIEHEQDWPAVLSLKEQNLLSPEAVFIPGHSMDFLAGSHLPLSDPEDVSNLILGKYFNLWPWQEMEGDVKTLVEQCLGRYLANQSTSEFELFDQFGWKERQSKMIANSVRVYEHHGYEWRLPYWDFDLVDFFLSLPRDWRIDKKLYLNLCQEILPASLMELPFSPPELGMLENKWTRLTDRNFSRQSMFSRSKLLPSIPSQRIETELSGLPDDVKAWFEPLRKNPLVSIPFNGQLALHQIIDQYKAT